MKPRDWLLLFLSKTDNRVRIDPIRIMKGLFLFSKKADNPCEEKYEFVPHSYGPFSKAVYDDLDELESEGQVARLSVMGRSWRYAMLTEAGEVKASELRASAPKNAVAVLDACKKDATTRSFNDLLKYVYEQYPDYATNSVWKQR